ncbi:NADH-quinone oxidoreductase subunit J [Thiocystis violacea]|uniref:NADH-quinone oxidoreductase subunit J n=1 Tax=Thiocystis violacea TaxID=13725 RepID=UPI001906D974|nr:NADH-quinone oxidoreductase subunit J [Thiocystis violacea]MBK1723078.1 NADH:ubiquinone oxidoreductase subunit J [Thiocystis violacea]
MGFEKFLFYVFALITLWASGMVITRKNPVHSVLFLVLAFVGSAALWVLLEAEFLGIVLVLVYVGAVMVLFLFVVMMLDVDIATLRAGFISYLPVGILIASVMAAEIFLIVGPSNFGLDAFPAPAPAGPDATNAADLGRVLYTVYLYPVEIAAVILLVAIVAAIRLTLRRRPDTKYVDPSRQVRVKKGPGRVRLVKMAAEDVAPATVGGADSNVGENS